jgi:hypothetical protein
MSFCCNFYNRYNPATQVQAFRAKSFLRSRRFKFGNYETTDEYKLTLAKKSVFTRVYLWLNNFTLKLPNKIIWRKNMCKTKYLIIISAILLLTTTAFADVVTIGTGTSTQRYPFSMWYGYTRSAALYLGSEIGVSGNITDLGWYIATLTNAANGPVKIYLKTSSATILTADLWSNMISGATLLYDQSATFVAGDWQTFNLSSSFSYSNSDNLLVLVETNYGGTGWSGDYTGKQIRYTTATSQHEYWQTDNTPPTGNGTVTSDRPNIQITISTGPPPTNDVGVMQILSPTATHRVGVSMTPSAKIKNYGTAANSFSVICSVVGSGGAIRHINTQSVTALPSNDSITLNFGSWTPTVTEQCTVKVRTLLGTDENPANNRKTQTTTIFRQYYTGGPDAGNMWWIDSDTTGGPVYNWRDISATGTNVVFPSFDDAIGRIPIGFNFTFYDKTRNRLTVGTNGALCLDSNAIALTNTTMPNSASPNNLIAALWDDLHVRKLGTVKYQTFGSTPNCTLVVSYDSIRYLGGGDSTLAFQFLLYESSNNIIIQYKNVITGHATRDAGLSATVGIEDSTGTIGLQYLNDGSPFGNLLSAGRAIRFYKYQFNNDVGVQQIISPLAEHLVGTAMTPKALIKNFGINAQSFVVRCSIINASGVVRHINQQSVTSLARGDTVTKAFGSWTPSVMEPVTVFVTTYLGTDEYPGNNQKTQVTNIGNTVTIGTGTTGGTTYTMYGYYNYAYSEAVYLQSEINFNGLITNIAYYKTSGTNTTQFDSVAIFMKHTTADSVAPAGVPDTAGYTLVYAGAFPINAIGWMDVTLNTPFLYNNVNNLMVLIVKGPPAMTTGYPSFAYTTTSPVTRNRYGYGATLPPTYNYRSVYRSNVRFTVMPQSANDVGTDAILAPLATHAVNALMTPSARVKNYGTSAQANFKVYCKIVGAVSGVRLDSITSGPLAAGVSETINFASWTPTVAELETVKIWTALFGDQYPANDLKTRTTDVITIIDAAVTAITRPYLSKEAETKRAPFTPEVTVTNNGSYNTDVPVYMEIWSPLGGVSNDFESDNGGYTADPPDTCWQWGTPTTVGPTSAHSSTKCWGTKLASNYSNNANWKLTTGQITAPSDNPDLKFWQWYSMEGTTYLYDGGNVKISINGGPWTVISPVGGYTGVAYTTNVGIPSESCYSGPTAGQNWNQVTFHLPVLSGQQFNIRWHFGTDPSVNSYAGWYIDDVTIGPPPELTYRDSTSVNVLAGTDASVQATFRPCTLMTEGSYHVKAYTLLSGDMVPGNDILQGSTTVAQATLTLSTPLNGSSTSDRTPTFSWNPVAGAEQYRIEIDDDSTFGSPYSELVASPFTLPEEEALSDGIYYWHVHVQTPGTPDDYSETWTLTIYTAGTPGWTQVESIPAPLDIKPGKFMKDGGSMVKVGGTKDGDDIYMFPGNKSWYFYMYTPGEPGTFTTLESIPYGVKVTDPTKYNKKKIGKGAALCFDNAHTIYATKGNGTTELWAYDILANTWTAKAFVPVPKALKGGTSIAYLDGKVYLLAGGQKKTDLVNFYVYDIATDAWTPSGLLTLGPNIKIWKDGACLTELDGTLYALKSNDKYNPFFSYNVLTNTWTEFDSIPMLDSVAGKAKKIAVKDGGAICAGGGAIYAIKGGGAQLFWKYTTLGGWTRQDTIPRLHKKSVAKTGAALAFANNRVYLMKSNNSPEFWQYVPTTAVAKPTPSTVTAVMVEKTNLTNVFSFNVAPNPFNRTTIIRYTVPVAGKVSVKLYNTSGRVVETINNSYLNQGNYTTTLNASTLASGVYFLRYEDQSNRAEIKLIVE